MVTTILVAPVAGVNCIQYDLAYGATAVSPATAEATTFANPTTKNYRKLPLGVQNWGTTAGAPLGSVGNDVDVKFQVPLILAPGEFFGILVRELNTAAGGLISVGCLVDAYWE